MSRRHAKSALAFSLLLALAACGGKPDAQPVAAAPALETLTVAPARHAGGVQWDGVVQAVEQAVLSAQTSGRVAALSADVDQRVGRGAVLLRLTAEEQAAAAETAKAQLRAAEAVLADAAQRFQRAGELVGRQLISRDEFDRVKAAHDSALAARDAVGAQLAQSRKQLEYTIVRAPYAGVVLARHVELGETVAPGQPLFTLYAPGQLRLEVQVPQSDAQAIRADGTAAATLPDGQQLQAAKVIVFPGADPLAHSTTVRVLLPVLKDPPRPGQTAKVRFAATAQDGIWLPAKAIVSRGELNAVYVVEGDGVVLRQLRLGASAGGAVEVLAGLVAGERVAADPVAALQWLQQRRAGGNAS